MLRHTFATRCIESGMPASVLAKIMGHANVATTLNVYCEVFDKFKKEHLSSSKCMAKHMLMNIITFSNVIIFAKLFEHHINSICTYTFFLTTI
mgnify:CR=1 FL=1